VLGLADLYDLVEIAVVDSHNERLASRAKED
jgi:hypothetical protein